MARGADEPGYDCEHCGARFPTFRQYALHRGVRHPERLDDAERETFAAAREDERERLRLFRLRAVGVLVVAYFGFLMLYAVVT